MIEVDRLMIEEYGIELIQMMENAGRNLAHLARERFFAGDPAGKRVIVLAGSGGNGGGTLACARRLHNYGATIQVFTSRPEDDFSPMAAKQLSILRRMGIRIVYGEPISSQTDIDLIIDGLIGYSLHGDPRGESANLIRAANQSGVPILALDVPSGIAVSDGAIYTPAILAAATMTLALPKAGLLATNAVKHVGELYLADISVPPELYAEPTIGLKVGDIFAHSEILRLV
jgi:NAD(P)H-hydrate epimerase